MATKQLGRDEVATIIENFVEGTGGKWDWDDFTTGTTFHDDYLKPFRSAVFIFLKSFHQRIRGITAVPKDWRYFEA
jgi:hypothetical protein